MNFKTDLEVDFKTHNKHQETPVFHRLKFDEVSIYLTKSTFHDLLTSKNEHGHYRIFSWDDWRAKRLLGFELGDESPALGSVNLVGHYKPTADDLTEIQYQTDSGKAYFDSAKGELEDTKKSGDLKKVKKINSRTFMRMAEIIPTGAQGKAIYGEGNYIIDGSAGTGKSTTVLQKIKLLQKQNSVSSERILVLVKNESVINEFKSLLGVIGITDIRLDTVQSFITDVFHAGFKDIGDELREILILASNIHRHLELIKKETEAISSGRVLGLGDNDDIIKIIFRHDSELVKLFDYYVDLRNNYTSFRSKNLKEFNGKKKDINTDVDQYKEALIGRLSESKKKVRNSFLMEQLNNKNQSSENKEILSLGEEADIRNKVFDFKKERESKLDRASKINREKEIKKHIGIKNAYKKIRLRILSHEFSENYAQNDIDKYLLQLHLKKFADVSADFHTIIVDEAQDAIQWHLHLAWLQADNVILTGDELQNENPDGIGAWVNLGALTDMFSTDEGINVFTLSHNFRQTYELGNCSFSFRQLALNKPLIDISDEYFENQKGFHKPQLFMINNPLEFASLVRSKIDLIYKTFADPMPVVIFYENDSSLNRLSSILETENISFGLDGDEKNSVMFVSIGDISGRSFPVVMAPLINRTNNSVIYIMLSRAKYDLCLFTGAEKEINSHVTSLVSKKIITKYD